MLSRGGDLGVHYLPFGSLSLTFTASYTDPKFLESSCVGAATFNGADCASPGGLTAKPVASEGDRLLATPWNLHFSGQYSHALPVTDTIVFGQNLTNEHPLMFESRDVPPVLPTSPPDNLYFARPMRPRTLGLTGTYRF